MSEGDLPRNLPDDLQPPARPLNAEEPERHEGPQQQDNPVVPPVENNPEILPAQDNVAVQPAPVLVNQEPIMQDLAEEPVQQQVVHREEVPRLNGQLPDLGLQALTVNPPIRMPGEEIRYNAPAPNLGEEGPRVNPPIQLLVSSDQQNRDEAWVSSLRVEMVGPSQHVYAPILDVPSPAEPPVQAPEPLDQPNVVAPIPIQTPEPQVTSKVVAQGPEPEPSMGSSQEDNSLTDPNETTSSMDTDSSSTTNDTSEDDNLPLSLYHPVPNNGPRGLFAGPLGQVVQQPTAPTRRYEGRPPRSRPIEIPPPTRALPHREEWTDEESTTSDNEPTCSKRRRSMDRPK